MILFLNQVFDAESNIHAYMYFNTIMSPHVNISQYNKNKILYDVTIAIVHVRHCKLHALQHNYASPEEKHGLEYRIMTEFRKSLS